MSSRSLLALSPLLFLLSAGALPTRAQCAVRQGRPSVDVRDCGAHSVTEPGFRDFDSTGALRDALAAADVIEIPAGTWLLSQVVITSGKTIRTSGLRTVLRQRPSSMPDRPGTPNQDFPLLELGGSDIDLGSFTAVGNIADDLGEWNHAVNIGSAAGPIARIHVGDIFGHDIRGDVLMIDGANQGATGAGLVSAVSFGTITGDNVYRSMVSINGGTDITGVAVGDRTTGGHSGYRTLDIEPNGWNQAPDGVVIGAVVGGSLQLASADPAHQIIGTVTIGAVDLDSARQRRPRPDYQNPADHRSGFDQSVGIIASSWHKLRIGKLRVAGKTRAALMAPSPANPDDGQVEIGHYQGSGNATDPQEPFPELHCAGCTRLRVDSGSTTLPKPASGATAKYFVSGGPDTAGTPTVVEIASFSLRGGGAFAATVAHGVFRHVTIAGTTQTATTPALFIDVNDSVFDDLRITGPHTLLWHGSRNVVMGTKLTTAELEDGASANNVVIGAMPAPPPRRR